MWIKHDSQEWKDVCEYAGFEDNQREAIKRAVFKRAKRLSSNDMIERLGVIGTMTIAAREEIRRAMEILSGYHNGASDNWRGSCKAVDYVDDLDDLRMADEEQKIAHRAHPKFPGGAFVFEQWDTTKSALFAYGDIVNQRKSFSVIIDRNVDPNTHETNLYYVQPGGMDSQRIVGPIYLAKERELSLIQKANAKSIKLCDAILSGKRRKEANRLIYELLDETKDLMK